MELLKQNEAKVWKNLTPKNCGTSIVGYSGIWRAIAKLAIVYIMKDVTLRRNPAKSELQKVMSISNLVDDSTDHSEW